MKFSKKKNKNNKMNKNYLSVFSRDSTCIKYDPLPEKRAMESRLGQ